ncbi:MAG TPA: hypothetical protein VKU90_06975 [Caulobacteraceae bacterium]|nr:hypothetical protein [Caulobacteraceae bacterium]
MRRTITTILAAGLAVILAGNGLAMLFAGAWWYNAVPGAPLTGPFNAHFVKDIGAAYLVCAAACAAFAWRPQAAWPALAAAAAFLTLHAAIHVADAIASPTCGQALMRDAPGVFIPALATLALAASRALQTKEFRHA